MTGQFINASMPTRDSGISGREPVRINSVLIVSVSSPRKQYHAP